MSYISPRPENSTEDESDLLAALNSLAVSGASQAIRKSSATGFTNVDLGGGSGTPGGSNTQLQYNNAGSFGGITGATTNGTVVTLTSPIFITPALGTPVSGVMTNVTGTAAGLTAGSATILATARTIGGVSFDGSANITVASATGGFTVSGGDLALGANNLTMTGSIGATGARVTKGWFTDIESTNMPTVGGTAILTSLTAPQFTTIELGHATDTTLSRSAAGVLAVEGVVIPSISSTNILTNKRKQPRVYSTASNTSLTPEIDTYDVFHITALAGAITINNHSTSTPADGEMLLIRLLDNGTARAITWGNAYVAKAGTALPTTTTLSKNMAILFEYNANLVKWNLLSVGTET